ncbi:MAG: right-handed parallel beta-helix repeat-containing protein [Chloroflexi bacterium]|nr:right-handed parallel beta-helix repeat-containing protein [Chloroflexota bacterium]
MQFVRSFSRSTVFTVPCLILLLAACGQRPPIETTILPAANESPTPFVEVQVSAAETQSTATATPTATLAATALATPTSQGTPALKLTPTIRATETISANEIASPTYGTPSAARTLTVTVNRSVTPDANACFGSINGSVVADLNANGEAEAGEPGVGGAKLFLYNASGVIGLYTTGNGQFYFPGLAAGRYTLTAAPPEGYTAAGQTSFTLDVNCNETLTQNILMRNGNGASANTTPTPPSRTKITPVASAQGTPRASRSGAGTSNFKPFTVAAVYDIAGCGSITAPGLYRLATSLSSKWDCIQIYSDNVILDCQGYSLNGTDMNGYGVVVHQIGNLLSQRPARNIEIRGCKSSKHKYGVFVDAADNLYIHDNTLSNNFRDTDERNFGQFLGLTEGGGIRVGSTTNALIADNRTDNNAIGIDVRTGSGITVRGNTANGNSAWGVHFYNVQYGEISENSAADNLRYCTWGNGTVGPGCDAGGIMLQSGSSKNVVRDNMITGGNGNGIFIKAHGTPCGDGNVIQGNTIKGALYNAIELSFCRENKIAGNHISNSLDGIWLGFAKKNEINNGNELRDLGNHGLISWNSSQNNVSSNTIVNSREALYFYSGPYDREQFFFVPGTPEDHVSTENCLCDNTLLENTAAAIHLNNSLRNQITQNKLTNNGVNFVMEGNTAGNIIQDNVIQGGSYNITAPRGQTVAFSNKPNALTAYAMDGRVLSRAEFLRAIWTNVLGESFDVRWFKYKMRISLRWMLGE